MSTSNHAPTRSPKGTRPVSRKFYESLCSLIRSAAIFSDDVFVEHFIHSIDDYIDHGVIISDFTDTEYVMFTLLQPQIDKALERSRRAREAAARRRETREQNEPQEQPCQSPTSSTTAPTPTAHEQKRAIRREAAKARRLQKHQERLTRRTTAQHRSQITTTTMPAVRSIL